MLKRLGVGGGGMGGGGDREGLLRIASPPLDETRLISSLATTQAILRILSLHLNGRLKRGNEVKKNTKTSKPS